MKDSEEIQELESFFHFLVFELISFVISFPFHSNTGLFISLNERKLQMIKTGNNEDIIRPSAA